MDKKILTSVTGALQDGKVVVFPTDTVYGLLADATNKKAVWKLYQIKKRSQSKAIPLFLRSISAVKKIALVDRRQERYIKKYWPGRTTFVLKRKKFFLYGVDRDTVALRIPKFPPLQRLLRSLSFPLTATSANISNNPPARSMKEAIRQFQSKKQKPDVFVDGGLLKGKPSTIIDLTYNPPKILRK